MGMRNFSSRASLRLPLRLDGGSAPLMKRNARALIFVFGRVAGKLKRNSDCLQLRAGPSKQKRRRRCAVEQSSTGASCRDPTVKSGDESLPTVTRIVTVGGGSTSNSPYITEMQKLGVFSHRSMCPSDSFSWWPPWCLRVFAARKEAVLPRDKCRLWRTGFAANRRVAAGWSPQRQEIFSVFTRQAEWGLVLKMSTAWRRQSELLAMQHQAEELAPVTFIPPSPLGKARLTSLQTSFGRGTLQHFHRL